jgi:ATP-binding protein involved in chromosome partitioning
MFRQVHVPVLGIVENMSYFMGDDGKRYPIFGQGGGSKLAGKAGVTLLGEIPIDSRVTECGDEGEPIFHRYPGSPIAQAYRALAGTVAIQLAAMEQPPELPGLQL